MATVVRYDEIWSIAAQTCPSFSRSCQEKRRLAMPLVSKLSVEKLARVAAQRTGRKEQRYIQMWWVSFLNSSCKRFLQTVCLDQLMTILFHKRGIRTCEGARPGLVTWHSSMFQPLRMLMVSASCGSWCRVDCRNLPVAIVGCHVNLHDTACVATLQKGSQSKQAPQFCCDGIHTERSKFSCRCKTRKRLISVESSAIRCLIHGNSLIAGFTMIQHFSQTCPSVCQFIQYSTLVNNLFIWWFNT